MATILPSILTNDIDVLKTRINLVKDYVGMFHIDVMDGQYEASHSLDIETIAKGIEDIGAGQDMEVHLMIKDPQNVFHQVRNIPHIKSVVLHPDSTEDINEAIRLYKNAGIEVGLSFLLDAEITLPETSIDFFLVLAIAKAGYSGTPFDVRGIDQIRWIKEHLPSYSIEVDGGINEENARMALDAGVTRLIVSSFIFNSDDPVQALQRLQQL